MDQRYEFDGAEVLALLEESRAAKERVMTEAQRYVAAGVDLSAENAAGFEGEVEHPGTGAPPGLWLMNDRGVYLRSNAVRRDADSVAYAASFRTGGRVGDEEMCEFIDAGMLGPLQPGDTLVVTLTERKVRLSLRRPA
jgi:hypothetical protein